MITMRLWPAAEQGPGWYVGASQIAGRGVFAGRDYPAGDKIAQGITKWGKITDFGSWINHSWTPNTQLDVDWYLRTITPVAKNTEFTLDYRQTPWFVDKPDPKWS